MRTWSVVCVGLVLLALAADVDLFYLGYFTGRLGFEGIGVAWCTVIFLNAAGLTAAVYLALFGLAWLASRSVSRRESGGRSL